MVEVATAAGRVAYGPVTAKDVPSLFDAGFATGGAHALSLGDPEKIPFFAKQTRLTFARCGITDPVSLDDYKAHDGLKGLQKAVAMAPAEIVKEVTEFGLARTRRRRLPDRHQVEDGARYGSRSQIHRLQCRRGRQRHLRRSHDHGGRSLRPDRRHGDRRQSRSARPRASSISARNIRMRRRP